MALGPPFRTETSGFGAVALTLLIVVSSVAMGLGGAVAAPADGRDSLAQDAGDDATLDPADEAYVFENGTAVLVYESESEDLSKTKFGLDVSEGLFHALVAGRTDAPVNGTAAATAVLERDRLFANGSMAVEGPDALRSMTLDVSGKSTDETSSLDATLDATVSAQEAPQTRLFESASTSGRVVTTASTFRTSGSASVQMSSDLGSPRSYEFSLTEHEGGYTLEGAESRVVAADARRRWSSEDRAEQVLGMRYGAIARQLGGEAQVTVESYSFTQAAEGGYRLDVAYTVEYSGIDEGLSQRVATMLAESEQYDLSDAEAERVGERIAAVEIDHVDVSFAQQPGSAEASWSARIEDYDGAVLAAIDVAQSMETATGSFAESLDRARAQFEAQQTANLTQRTTWSASLDSPDRQTVAVSAEVHVSTDDWAAYREQLRQRGFDPASTTFSLHAETDGEQLTASGEFEMRKEDLVDGTVDQLLNASRDSGESTQGRKFLRAFGRADLRKARADVSLDGRNVTVEAGAKFNNLTAFRDALSASGDLPPVAAVAGRSEGETTRTYVYVVDAVSEDATESDVRAEAYVDGETEVHMGGSFDRSFPKPDAEAAREYLGLPEDGGSGIASGPGFGPVGALAALAALGALLARRE